MFIAPAPNSAEVFDDLTRLAEADSFGGDIDEVLLERVRRSATNLLKSDPVAGHIALSAVAALKWDVQTALDQVEAACRRDRSSVTLFNAITTFESLNRSDLAHPYVMAGLSMAAADEGFAAHAMSSLLAGGYLEDAITLQDMVENAGEVRQLSFDAKRLAVYLSDLCVNFEHFQSVLTAANEVLANERRCSRDMSILPDTDPDGGSSVLIEIGFNGTIDDEFRLEEVLSDRLGENPAWNPAKFTANFRYRKPGNADHTS